MKEKNNHLSRIILILIFIQIFLFYAFPQVGDLADVEEKHSLKYQPPDRIMDAMCLREGMVIGDIGAGGGRFSVWFAQRVGKSGKVYANDIDLGALMYLKKRAKDLGFNNIETILGSVSQTNIPTEKLDIAFIISSYHHFRKPIELMKDLKKSIKSSGILVICEADPEAHPEAGGHATSKKVLINQLEEAGYELIRIEDWLPRDFIYFFKVRNNSDSN